MLAEFTMWIASLVAQAAGPDMPADGPVRTAAFEQLSLAEAVEHARANATRVKRASARVELGRAEESAAKPLLPANPSLYVGTGARTNPLGARFELQAQLSQPLEIAGERRLRRQAASKHRRALERGEQAARWQAEVDARAAFYRALLAKRRLDAAQLTEEFSRRVLATTEVLVESGQESKLRLHLAEAELADATQARMNAELIYRTACYALAQEIGWRHDQPVYPSGSLPAPLTHPLPDDVVEAVSAHPLAQHARSRVEALEANHRAARRDAWPHPSLGAYVATEREPGTAFRSQVGLGTLTIPLPTWRRNQGARARASAQLQIAKTELTTLQRELAWELTRALDSVKTSSARLATYTDEVLPGFSSNLELVRRSFELGEIDLLEVFLARERFLRQQREALDVYGDYIEARHAYEAAAGVPCPDTD